MEKEKVKDLEDELNQKLFLFEQQIQLIYQELKAVEKTLTDLVLLGSKIEGIKKEKEIFSNLGKGIYIKSKIISEDFLIGITDKHFAKKNLKETKKIIEEQISKLQKTKDNLNKELERVNQELSEAMLEYQKNIQKYKKE